MNKRSIITLADAIGTVRPDWSHTGIVNQLTTLDSTWTGTDAELYAHAMTIAANPAAQTPGALNAKVPAAAARQPTSDPFEKEPHCYICGNTKTACEKQQDFEISHNIPDPHVFETGEDAETNAAPITTQRKAAIMGQIRGLLKNVNDEPGMKHAVEAEQRKVKQ